MGHHMAPKNLGNKKASFLRQNLSGDESTGQGCTALGPWPLKSGAIMGSSIAVPEVEYMSTARKRNEMGPKLRRIQTAKKRCAKPINGREIHHGDLNPSFPCSILWRVPYKTAAASPSCQSSCDEDEHKPGSEKAADCNQVDSTSFPKLFLLSGSLLIMFDEDPLLYLGGPQKGMVSYQDVVLKSHGSHHGWSRHNQGVSAWSLDIRRCPSNHPMALAKAQEIVQKLIGKNIKIFLTTKFPQLLHSLRLDNAITDASYSRCQCPKGH